MQQAGVKTVAVSEVQVRDEHEMDLERPSPQLTGEFNSNDAARAQTLDPHRERLILVGVVLFDHWQTATASEVQVRSEHEMHLERPSPQLTGRFTKLNISPKLQAVCASC